MENGSDRRPPAPTPSYLIKARLVLSTWCPKCLRYGRKFEGEDLAEKYGVEADLNELASRMVCDNCGHRGAETRVNTKAVPFSEDWERQS